MSDINETLAREPAPRPGFYGGIHRASGGKNIFLDRLQPDDAAAVRVLTDRVTPARGERLAQAGEAIEHAYFLEDGVASVIGGHDKAERTEVGVLGREGIVGLPLALGVGWAVHDVLIQTPAARALRITAAALVRLMRERPAIRELLLRVTHAYLVQSAQSIISASRDRMEVRLARWLLMCHDRVTGDDVDLTHEFMSVMIAAQRTGVTVTLHVLEGQGLVRSTRGRVTIVDRAGLEALAGGSYGMAEAEYRRAVLGAD